MIKKDITFEDFEGNEVVETHYFHLGKMEIIRAESAKVPLTERLQEVLDSKDREKLTSVLEELILMSYGIREDNKTFRKSDAIRDAFKESLAYEELFVGLLQNPESGNAFIEGVLPAKLLQEAKAEAAKQRGVDNVELPASFRPPTQDHQQKAPKVVEEPAPYVPVGFQEQDFSD